MNVSAAVGIVSIRIICKLKMQEFVRIEQFLQGFAINKTFY